MCGFDQVAVLHLFLTRSEFSLTDFFSSLLFSLPLNICTSDVHREVKSVEKALERFFLFFIFLLCISQDRSGVTHFGQFYCRVCLSLIQLIMRPDRLGIALAAV